MATPGQRNGHAKNAVDDSGKSGNNGGVGEKVGARRSTPPWLQTSLMHCRS